MDLNVFSCFKIPVCSIFFVLNWGIGNRCIPLRIILIFVVLNFGVVLPDTVIPQKICNFCFAPVALQNNKIRALNTVFRE